jgi:hypothetical protein
MDRQPRCGGSYRSEGCYTDRPPDPHTTFRSQPLNKFSVAAGCDRDSSRYAMRALEKAPLTSFNSSIFTTNGHKYDGDPELSGEEDEEGSVVTFYHYTSVTASEALSKNCNINVKGFISLNTGLWTIK